MLFADFLGTSCFSFLPVDMEISSSDYLLYISAVIRVQRGYFTVIVVQINHNISIGQLEYQSIKIT